MERHGSESPFVLGEGLLDECAGGRASALSAQVAAAPPFRFSRTSPGARIVAETFHRAIEGSSASIVRDPAWRPTLGPDPDTFRMVDLLLFAFEGKKSLLAPLG